MGDRLYYWKSLQRGQFTYLLSSDYLYYVQLAPGPQATSSPKQVHHYCVPASNYSWAETGFAAIGLVEHPTASSVREALPPQRAS